MKKADLTIGAEIAYVPYGNASEPRLYDIEKVVIESLECEKGWRADKQTVLVRRDRTRQVKQEDGSSKTESYSEMKYVRLQKLIGDYATVVLNLTVKEKNNEINRLKRQIETTRLEAVRKDKGQVLLDTLEIARWRGIDLEGNEFVLKLNETQFTKLSGIVATYNRDYPKEQA